MVLNACPSLYMVVENCPWQYKVVHGFYKVIHGCTRLYMYTVHSLIRLEDLFVDRWNL